MSKIGESFTEYSLSKLYLVAVSQRKFFDDRNYWDEADQIMQPNFATWYKVELYMSSDLGCAPTYLISLHRHLGLSKRTSPYSILSELRTYLSQKIGADIFDYSNFEKWEQGLPNGSFSTSYPVNLLI